MNAEKSVVREPAVAGQFYPGNRAQLSAELDDMLDRENTSTVSGRVRALISPHAGYVYSGRTAGKGFALLKNCEYRRIIVIAPSHRVHFRGLAASEYTAYRTPLGDVSVDIDAVYETVSAGVKGIEELTQAHIGEHALEVQLPFLQKVLPDVPVVPFICGELDDALAETLAGALMKFWNEDTLWVISSDFTHYGYSFGYLPFTDNVKENLKALDMGAVEKITDLDYIGLSNYIKETGATICGAAPVKLLLKTIETAHSANSVKAELIEYTNSGELTGDFSHAVGYASIKFSSKT
jgi:AmmeMemoRadiSam system protein B